MLNEYQIRADIRSEYIGEYAERERGKAPRLSKLGRGMDVGGIMTFGFGAVGATLGMIAAWGFAVPYAMVAVAAGSVLGALGAAAFSAGSAIDRHFTKKAEPVLEADISSFKLVKSYIRDKLAKQQEDFDRSRTGKEAAYRNALAMQDKKEANFAAKRKAALKILAGGLDVLDQQNDAAEKDLEFFRKQAEQALGPDFAASAPRPPVAEMPPAFQARGIHRRPA